MFRALSDYLPTMCMDRHLAALDEGTQTHVSIFTRGIYETIAGSSPRGSKKILEVLTSARATLSVYEGDVSHVLGIMDKVVYIDSEHDLGVRCLDSIGQYLCPSLRNETYKFCIDHIDTDRH